MCSVISGVYKMKKRCTSDAAVVSSADRSIYRPTNGVSANGHQQQRNHAFLSNTSPAGKCPRTPRRSPRLIGGFSRTSGSVDSNVLESPDSQEMLITWKCNSPVYTKSLCSAHGRDLKEIVGKFVPATNATRKPSKSLLDIWMADCETIELPPPIKTLPVKHNSKEPQVVREMEEFIKEVDRYRTELLSDRMTNSERTTNCGRVGDVWEDEDIFDDEDVIALTQRTEDACLTMNTNKIGFPKTESACATKVQQDDKCLNVQNDANDILVLDTDITETSPNVVGNLEDDDDSLLWRPTQAFVEETSREASVSPDVMDRGFVGPVGSREVHSGDSDVAPMSPNKTTICRREEIQRKKEEALRRRSARLRFVRENNAVTVSVCLMDRSTVDRAALEQPKAQDKTVTPKEPVAPVMCSQVSICSQVRSQQEIQRNREEALKRRSARLAAHANSKSISNAFVGSQQYWAAATTASQSRKGLCSVTEIERKKREAMERRQRKLMALKS